MTSAARTKTCTECCVSFVEKKGLSDKQWQIQQFCSIRCKNVNLSRKNTQDVFERLRSKQIRIADDECWKWSGYKDARGYGIISSRKKGNKSPEKAHRVSFELTHGPIPLGMVVMHKCDNPECTNPNHLELGTQKQNMKDCSSRGRLNKRSTSNLISGAKGYLGAAVEKNRINHG